MNNQKDNKNKIELENIILTPGIHKYIHIVDKDGKDHVYQMEKDLHREIKNAVEDRVGDISYISGGFIKYDPDNKTIEIEDKSQDFGRADHGYVKRILEQRLGSEYNIQLETGFVAKENARKATIFQKEYEIRVKKAKLKFDQKKNAFINNFSAKHQEIIEKLPVEKRLEFYENLGLMELMPERDRVEYVHKELDDRSSIKIEEMINLLDKMKVKKQLLNEVITKTNDNMYKMEEIFAMLDKEEISEENYKILLLKAIDQNSGFSESEVLKKSTQDYKVIPIKNLRSCYNRLQKADADAINRKFIDTLVKQNIGIYFAYDDEGSRGDTLGFLKSIIDENDINARDYRKFIKKAISRNLDGEDRIKSEVLLKNLGLNEKILDALTYKATCDVYYSKSGPLHTKNNVPIKGQLKKNLESCITEKLYEGKFEEAEEKARSFRYDESGLLAKAMRMKIDKCFSYYDEVKEDTFESRRDREVCEIDLYKYFKEAVSSKYSEIAKKTITEFHKEIGMDDHWYWDHFWITPLGDGIHNPKDNLTTEEKIQLVESYMDKADRKLIKGNRNVDYDYFKARRIAREFGFKNYEREAVKSEVIVNYTNLKSIGEKIKDADFESSESKDVADSIYQMNLDIIDGERISQCPCTMGKVFKTKPSEYFDLARFAKDMDLDKRKIDYVVNKGIELSISEGDIRTAYWVSQEFGKPSKELEDLLPFV